MGKKRKGKAAGPTRRRTSSGSVVLRPQKKGAPTKKSIPTKEWDGNHYSGFKIPQTNWKPDVVNVADLTPERFFELYVKTRTPVILQGHGGLGPSWKGDTWVANDCASLLAAAGDEPIQVEVREDSSQPFGQGRVRKMPFREVMQSLLRGEETLYVTTQDLPVDEEERPGLCSTPVTQLLERGEFDMRPPLMGNLLPFNFNLWIGASKNGSTSGLHHDYHDNLYVLLAGRKDFRLYSPADAQAMSTVGDLYRVHPNGRINYKGALTQADGASEAAVASLAASRKLESIMNARKPQIGSGEDEDSDAIEAALDAVLEAEMEEGGGGFDDRDSGDDTAQEEKQQQPATPETKDGLPAIVPPPENFSRVGSYRKDTSQWPNFQRCLPGDAELSVGQMLYLPAGWFHEVTSLCAPSSEAAPQFHMAFNFWFHPPDRPDFAAPYSGDFWASDWVARGFKPLDKTI